MPFSGYEDLNGQFAMNLQAMIGAARGAGLNIGISSGYRSPERQAELFRQAVAKYGSEQAARKWVAPPGKSNHGKGTAVDLSFGNAAAREWVHANAAKFGLHFPMDWEPWHIEPLGGAQMADRDAYTTPPAGHGHPQDMAPDPHDIGTQFENFIATMSGGIAGTEMLETAEPTAAPQPFVDAQQPEDIMGTVADTLQAGGS